MAQLSLILPTTPFAPLAVEPIRKIRASLEGRGHAVECIVIQDPRVASPPSLPEEGWRSSVAEYPGLSAAAIAGLEEGKGDVLLLLDSTRGYSAEDLQRVIEPVLGNDADLAIASPRVDGNAPSAGRLQTLAGRLARRFVRTSDPLSGLVALAPRLIETTEFAPIGSLFALELAVRTDGRAVDVPIAQAVGSARRHWAIDDLRFLKRLADDRFGNFSRLIQFCFVGASGMVVDLSCYALFQWLFSQTWLASSAVPLIGGPLSLAVAAALAIGIALTWNFSLNRRLTFSYARDESIFKQFLAYALSNALGIILSYSLRLLLPRYVGYFQRHKLAAALVGIVTATGISFSMARWFVFARRHTTATSNAKVAETSTLVGVAGPNEARDTASSYASPNLSASALEPL